MNLKFRVFIDVLPASVIAPSWVMAVLMMLNKVTPPYPINLAHPHVFIRCSSLDVSSFHAKLPSLEQRLMIHILRVYAFRYQIDLARASRLRLATPPEELRVILGLILTLPILISVQALYLVLVKTALLEIVVLIVEHLQLVR